TGRPISIPAPHAAQRPCTPAAHPGGVNSPGRTARHSTDTPLLSPASAAGNAVAGFGASPAAQRAVDELADEGFPVSKLDIIGSDLRLVERVTGRLTKARAAGAGAIAGMWAGLLIGLLLGLFTT